MRSIAVALVCCLTLACNQGEKPSEAVKRAGGGGYSPPIEKPTQKLEAQILLAWAGVALSEEIIRSLLAQPPSCAKRSGQSIEWNCRESSGQTGALKGLAEFQSQPVGWRLVSDPRGLLAAVTSGSRQYRLSLWMDLTYLNGQFKALLTSSHQLGQGAAPLVYTFEWDLRGTLQTSATPQLLGDLDLLLTINKQVNGRRVQSWQYSMTSAAGPLAIQCGQSTGQLLFHRPTSEVLAVVADATGLRLARGNSRHAWPACQNQFYGLKLVAPFVPRPEPGT